MKKLLSVAALAGAVLLSSCGGNKTVKMGSLSSFDSLSYALGASIGYGMQYEMSDIPFNFEEVNKGIKEGALEKSKQTHDDALNILRDYFMNKRGPRAYALMKKKEMQAAVAADSTGTLKDTLPAPGTPVLLKKDLVYASVQRYDTVPAGALPFESHRNYIDLHYLVSGQEAVFCCSRENLRDPGAYDEKKDCETSLSAENSFRIPLRTKDFLILFPGEAHRPKCSLDIDSPVCKIVVKIRAL